MELNIKKNPMTGGHWCVFQKGKEFFYADRSPIHYLGIMETMIFPYDVEEEKVTSWTELYCDQTGKSLEDCVKEFLMDE